MKNAVLWVLFGAFLGTLVTFPAGAAEKVAMAAEESSAPDFQDFQLSRQAFDYLHETFSQAGIQFRDLRVAPKIQCEGWAEIPLETGLLATEDKLVPVLERIGSFSSGGGKLTTESAMVCVSAESLPDGKPLLTANLYQKLFTGEKVSESDLKARHDRLTRVLAGVLKMTTFIPQIRRKAEVPAVATTGRHWVTNLRIDSDLRLQVTGYALDFPDVTRFAEELYQTGAVQEVALTSANRNIYQKQPVWRFDLVARAR